MYPNGVCIISSPIVEISLWICAIDKHISKNPKSLCELAMHHKISQGLKGTHILVDLTFGMDGSGRALQEEGRSLVSAGDSLEREHKVAHPWKGLRDLACDSVSWMVSGKTYMGLGYVLEGVLRAL